MKASGSIMTLVMLAIFVGLVVIASGYPPDARFMPFVVGIPAIALCLLQLALDFRRGRPLLKGAESHGPLARAEPTLSGIPGGLPAEAKDGPSTRETVRREAVLWASFLAFIGGILLFGYWVSIPVFLVAFLRFQAKASWRATLILGIAGTVILFLAIEKGFRVDLHPGFVTEYLMDQIQE